MNNDLINIIKNLTYIEGSKTKLTAYLKGEDEVESELIMAEFIQGTWNFTSSFSGVEKLLDEEELSSVGIVLSSIVAMKCENAIREKIMLEFKDLKLEESVEFINGPLPLELRKVEAKFCQSKIKKWYTDWALIGQCENPSFQVWIDGLMSQAISVLDLVDSFIE